MTRDVLVRIAALWWPAIVLGLVSIWVVQPMHDVTWWASHEHVWYPVRVHEYLRSWHAGTWYPRWCPDLYGGYGYPFHEYYAPGVYFSAAVISELGALDPIASLKVLVTLVTIASAIGAYGLVRGETGRTDAALLGGACYVLLPYRCTDLFARGDLAEYCAYCLVPFAAWAYRALTRASGRRAVATGCAAALLHAGILLTHTLIGMFTTELVGLYAVTLLVHRRRGAAILVAVAVAFAIAISAVYIVPAFLERDLVFLDRVTGDRYRPWLNAVSPSALTDPFFTPGWPFFLGLAAWAIAWAIQRARPAARRAAVPWAIAIVMIVLMLPVVVSIWKVLPFGAEVQFPWRLLGFVGLSAALGVAVCWAQLVPRTRWAAAVALALCLPLPALLSAQRKVTPEYPVPQTDEEIRAAFNSSTVMDEYLPRKVLHAPPGPRDRLAWADDAAVSVRAHQLDGLHQELEIDAPHEATVTLATFGFRGWQARTIEGPANAQLRVGSGDGLLRVVAPQPGHYVVSVYFGRTGLRTGAALASLFALLALIPALLFVVRRARVTAP